MKRSSKPSHSELDQLTAFLPILSADGYNPVKEWFGGVKNKDGMIQLPYPDYDEAVIEFFRTAANDCWLDYQYNPRAAGLALENEKVVVSASLEEIRTLFLPTVKNE